MATLQDIQQLFDEFGTNLVNDTKKSLDAKGHTSEGQSGLIGSVRFTVTYSGDNLVFVLKMDDYWKYIDKGTKPARKKSSIADRQKKIQSLMDWATSKNINALSWYKKKLKNPNKSKMTYEGARQSLANAISHNISKKGIIKRFGYKGSHFFTDVIEDGRVQQLENDLSQLLKRSIEIQLELK